MNPESTVYHKRRHAARTTDEYLSISWFLIWGTNAVYYI